MQTMALKDRLRGRLGDATTAEPQEQAGWARPLLAGLAMIVVLLGLIGIASRSVDGLFAVGAAMVLAVAFMRLLALVSQR